MSNAAVPPLSGTSSMSRRPSFVDTICDSPVLGSSPRREEGSQNGGDSELNPQTEEDIKLQLRGHSDVCGAIRHFWDALGDLRVLEEGSEYIGKNVYLTWHLKLQTVLQLTREDVQPAYEA